MHNLTEIAERVKARLPSLRTQYQLKSSGIVPRKSIYAPTPLQLADIREAYNETVPVSESLIEAHALLVDCAGALEEMRQFVPKELHKQEGFFTRWWPNPSKSKLEQTLARLAAAGIKGA